MWMQRYTMVTSLPPIAARSRYRDAFSGFQNNNSSTASFLVRNSLIPKVEYTKPQAIAAMLASNGGFLRVVVCTSRSASCRLSIRRHDCNQLHTRTSTLLISCRDTVRDPSIQPFNETGIVVAHGAPNSGFWNPYSAHTLPILCAQPKPSAQLEIEKSIHTNHFLSIQIRTTRQRPSPRTKRIWSSLNILVRSIFLKVSIRIVSRAIRSLNISSQPKNRRLRRDLLRRSSNWLARLC